MAAPINCALGKSFALFGLLLASSASAANRPADSVQQLFVKLKACLGHVSGPPGSQITLRFSLRRDGSLIGRPVATYSLLTGSPPDRLAFVSSAFSTLNGCLPLPISRALGGAIAGQPITVRILAG